jgi:hypothetical protein
VGLIEGGVIMDQAKIMEYAKLEGYDGAEYLGRYHDFFCYAPFYDLPVGEAVPPTGLPCLILVDQAGNIHLSSPDEAILYGDGIKKQLEADFVMRFGGRLYYACPSGWPIYTHRGRDYLLEGSAASPEAVMKASLEQGENLLITTFPVVDLYPDPNCDY